jgi:hypothetical protein
VGELNEFARQLMDADGRLGADRISFAEHEFATGDRVVCLRNSHRLGVTNGTAGTVERVDRDARTVTMATDRGPTTELSRAYLQAGNLRHAYALTGHAAQGLTVERAFVLGSGEARLQEWGYVALSRARTETRLYVTGTARERESHFHDIDERDPLERFGRALEESAGEELAIHQRPLTSGPRHDARPEIERPELTRAEATQRRLLEHKRRALSATHDRAEKRLEEAERALAGCGALRRHRRDSLRAEVELERSAIRELDRQLAETTEAVNQVRRASLTRDRTSHARSPQPLIRER